MLKVISDICVSMKAEDYLELPACIDHEIPVLLDDKAKKAYDQFERDLLLEVDEDVITASAAGVLIGMEKENKYFMTAKVRIDERVCKDLLCE